MDTASDDATEWALAMSGEGEAFGRIFDRYRVRILRHSSRLVASESEREDVVAIVFLEAWRKRQTIHFIDGSMLPWLLVTATNAAENVARSSRRYQRLLQHLPPALPIADHAEKFEEGEAQSALRRLAGRDQQILTLCLLEGISEKDVSAMLKIAPGTVKSRLSRAKARLAAHLNTPAPFTPFSEGKHPMATETPHDRTTELRNVLVATANSNAYLRSHPSRKRVIASIAAFALAGALTGGAVSAVATTNSVQSNETANARFQATEFVGTHGRLLGSPINYVGAGSAALDLGKAPRGATAVVVGFDCLDGADVEVSIDSVELLSHGNCESAIVQELPVAGAKKHSMAIDATGAGRYAVYASWVDEAPLPGPSAAQQEVMADGKLTRTEYLAALNRFAGCLTAAGYPLSAVPDDYVYYPYAVTAEAVASGADARCYASEFKEVDPSWQISVRTAVDACLVGRGIKPPGEAADLTTLLEQLLPLHLTFDQCVASQ